MSAEDLSDLDFTRVMPARARPQPEAAPPAEALIGTLRDGHAGNFICYARSIPLRPTVAEAPIVVVDDDSTTRQLLGKALLSLGYPVRGAGDGAQFQLLLRKPPLPRLILLDVELPQVNGFKILSVLRQHPQTSGIPLVMLTARSDNKDLLQALSLGADGYLSKPVTLATLRSVVDRLLRRNH